MLINIANNFYNYDDLKYVKATSELYKEKSIYIIEVKLYDGSIDKYGFDTTEEVNKYLDLVNSQNERVYKIRDENKICENRKGVL